MSHIQTLISKYSSAIALLLVFIYIGNVQAHQPVDTVKEVANLIEKHYILPEVAVEVANKLRIAAKAGEYSKYSDTPLKLADALTKDIINYSQDKHFYIEYINRKTEQINWIEQWLKKAPSKNFGIKKIEILKGNVGYLAISSFYPLDIAKQSIKAAMELIQHTQGLILDLRKNGGGDESSTRAILATFLPEGHEGPLFIESRKEKKLMGIPKKLDWSRYSQQKKLVIILNNRTFSAPESLAFSLQEMGRALVIGTNSAGGAHMTDAPLTVSGGYEIGIPNKRPISKSTGENWEGTGVIPDIESNDMNALETALKQFDKPKK